jgi:hypothetical protein
MTFLSLNLFPKLVKGFRKRKHSQRHVSAPGHATWHSDGNMTSMVGSGLLTSAVGPTEVSVDR